MQPSFSDHVANQPDDFIAMAGILLDRAETLLLGRKSTGGLNLHQLTRIFRALRDDARAVALERVALISESATRLLELVQQRGEAMRLELEDLLLDAVDEIREALLNGIDDDDSSVRLSLERRILRLAPLH